MGALRQRWRVVRSATGASGVVEVLGDQPVLTQLRPPSTSGSTARRPTPNGAAVGTEADPQVFATVSGAERSPSPDARVKQMSWLGRSEERARRLSRSASPSRRASRPSEGKERLLSPRKTPPPSAPPPRSTEDVELSTMAETSEELDPIVTDVWVELPQEDEVARRSRVFGEVGVTGGEVWVRHWLRLRCTVLELFTESQKQRGTSTSRTLWSRCAPPS